MNNSEVVYLYLDDIIPNRFQPREIFDDQALKELAVSIKEHGVIQPIIVRQVENKYEIIAGERRYKASTMAGLTKIPAIVKNLDDKESSKIALIENLQRKDLTPIEEARTYQKILELEDGMTQEQLAATMGKTQSSVSNKLRLLALPDEIQDALLKEKISERHARSLLNVEDKNTQIRLMDKVISEKMTVRELDKEIKELTGNSSPNEEVNTNPVDPTTPSFIDVSLPLKDNQNTNVNTVNNNVEEEKVPENNNINNENGDNMDNQNSNNREVPLNDLNPTEVDINKIRENAQDIGGQKNETMPVDDLMKNETEDQSFKFVPSFGNESNDITNPPQEETNMFNQFFNSNVSSNNNSSTNNEESNNNVSSMMNSMNLSVPSVSPVEENKVDGAKNSIKSSIESLKNNGCNIDYQESDTDTEYKITITIQK